MAKHRKARPDPVRIGEVWKVNDAEKLTGVHRMEDCQGDCPLHNPTEHSMRDFTLHFRQDAMLFERICGHGIGHPDPDSLRWFESQGIKGYGVHGCDGCCAGAYDA